MIGYDIILLYYRLYTSLCIKYLCHILYSINEIVMENLIAYIKLIYKHIF